MSKTLNELRGAKSRRQRAILAGLAGTGLVCLFFCILHSREPVYQKKGLSMWVRQLSEGDAGQRQEAFTAIRAMGEPAVPVLSSALRPRDARLRGLLISFTGHFLSMRDKYISVEAERGYTASALGAIGPAARAAIPALLQASNDTNSFCAARAKAALIQIRQDARGSVALPSPETRNLTNWLEAAEVLLCLGSNVQASAQDMVEAIGASHAQRFEIVEALGKNGCEPNASVLLLRGLLKDKEPGIRMNVLNMLMMQRTFAKACRKDVIQCTNDPNASVRANARIALMFDFPEQAASETSTKEH